MEHQGISTTMVLKTQYPSLIVMVYHILSLFVGPEQRGTLIIDFFEETEHVAPLPNDAEVLVVATPPFEIPGILSPPSLPSLGTHILICSKGYGVHMLFSRVP